MVSDPTLPNHSTSACPDKIYPFVFGQSSSDVVLLDAVMDSYGNHLLCGMSDLPPFASN